MRSCVTIALVFLMILGGICANAYSQREVDLRGFMQVKLQQSQKGLEGLVLGDLDIVAKNAEEMKALSLDETWQVMTTPQYIEYSRKFREAADTLSAAAKKHNLEKSTVAFNQVTNRCVECHKYIRDARMAKAGQ